MHVGALFTDGPIDLGERRTAQAVLSSPEVDQQQLRFSLIQLQQRRQGASHVHHRSKSTDNQRQGRGNGIRTLASTPNCFHRQGIFADRNRNPEPPAQRAHRLDRIK